MKKIIALALCLIMAMSMAAVAEGTLLIGGIGPLTGDYATYGVSVNNGAKIAVEEINAAGGVNGITLALQFEDDQTDSEAAKMAYYTLLDAGMKVSLGAVTSGACIEVGNQTVKDNMLMITPSGSQLECIEVDNAFRICFADPYQGLYSADFVADNELATKIGIIYDKSNDYSVGICDSFVNQAEVRGLNIVTKQAFTSSSNTDFSVQVQACVDEGCDLVFLPIYAQEAAYILTQAKAVGLNAIFFGCDGMDGILEKIGADNLDATNGVMLLTPFSADAKDELTQNFVAKYKELHGMTPDQFAADGYDAVYTVKAALEQAGITDVNDPDFNEKVIAAMYEITVNGLTGVMTWNEAGEPVKAAKAVVIQDGAYVLYEK